MCFTFARAGAFLSTQNAAFMGGRYCVAKDEKGRDRSTDPALSFIVLVELLEFSNAFDRHLVTGHLAGDFEFGALILFALFERGLGQLIPLRIEQIVLAAGVNAKPAVDATGH